MQLGQLIVAGALHTGYTILTTAQTPLNSRNVTLEKEMV
jgi:hypothetical protein